MLISSIPRYGAKPQIARGATGSRAERCRRLWSMVAARLKANRELPFPAIAPLHAGFLRFFANDIRAHALPLEPDGSGRFGQARLGSLYGIGQARLPFQAKLERLMRDGPRMRLSAAHRGTLLPIRFEAADACLLRLRELLMEGSVSLAEVPESFERPPRAARPINRLPADRAIIEEPRNDEDPRVAAIHAVLLRFHNVVVSALQADRSRIPQLSVFVAARRLVRWHYQWLLVNDLLPSLADIAALPRALLAVRRPEPGGPQAEGHAGLAHFATLMEWAENAEAGQDGARHPSDPFHLDLSAAGAADDALLAPEHRLIPSELLDGPAGGAIGDLGLLDDPPLWYYLVCETRHRAPERRFGPVASLILAHAMTGAIVHDPTSYVSAGRGTDVPWHPLDSRECGRPVTSLHDLLEVTRVRLTVPRSRADRRN
jgi:hypothetical protein